MFGRIPVEPGGRDRDPALSRQRTNLGKLFSVKEGGNLDHDRRWSYGHLGLGQTALDRSTSRASLVLLHWRTQKGFWGSPPRKLLLGSESIPLLDHRHVIMYLLIHSHKKSDVYVYSI